MKNLWNTSISEKLKNDLLGMRVYSSRLLGQYPDLVLHGGGNTSVKIKGLDFFGVEKELLYVKGSGWDLKTIEPTGFAGVDLETLKKMSALDSISDKEMVKIQRSAMNDPNAPNPSVEAVLHAIIPFRFVDHTHADAIVTLSNTPDGERLLHELCGPRILIIPYVMPGFLLAKAVAKATENIQWDELEGIILMNHGVFTFHNEAKQSYSRMIALVTQAEDFIKKNCTQKPTRLKSQKPDLVQLSKIRQKVSISRGKTVLAKLSQNPEAVEFSSLGNIHELADRGPLTPDHIIRTKRNPVIITKKPGENIRLYETQYTDYFKRFAKDGMVQLDPAPRWGVWPKQGVVAFGSTIKETRVIKDIADHTITAIQTAEGLGGWNPLKKIDLFEMEYWELEQAKLKQAQTEPEFMGKIVLVTGAANGIGEACVRLFHEKGAVVAALDIQKGVIDQFDSDGILGTQCDVTSENSLKSAVEQTVLKFGGLDLVVSNAGIFPPGSSIHETDKKVWEDSLRLNLTSHQSLMKYCLPYLKNGIDPAIVVVGSKNVPAPGPGASAYSVAKAGLTQLARIAALEMGEWGIRVNVVHPNMVFDTQLWTSEKIKSRADRYGLTPENYMQNNVLNTRISSKDVAELITCMAGKAFLKTTGAQVPIDGGNDRVI